MATDLGLGLGLSPLPRPSFRCINEKTLQTVRNFSFCLRGHGQEGGLRSAPVF